METTTLDWINVAALLVSPILAGATALGIYRLGRRDAELTRFRQQRRYIVTQLRVELAANDRIISQSLKTIPPVLEMIPHDADPNDVVITEDVFLAPLFTASFEGLVVNDLTHHIRAETIERLYDYYSTAARANWLIGRVQGFKYRGLSSERLKRRFMTFETRSVPSDLAWGTLFQSERHGTPTQGSRCDLPQTGSNRGRRSTAPAISVQIALERNAAQDRSDQALKPRAMVRRLAVAAQPTAACPH